MILVRGLHGEESGTWSDARRCGPCDHAPAPSVLGAMSHQGEWSTLSAPYEPTPGVYALYQNGVLKYVGQSSDCGTRIHHHHGTKGLGWHERKPAWERGVPFTARVLPLPGLDEPARIQWERYWIYHLRPPCNRIPRNEPSRPR